MGPSTQIDSSDADDEIDKETKETKEAKRTPKEIKKEGRVKSAIAKTRTPKEDLAAK